LFNIANKILKAIKYFANQAIMTIFAGEDCESMEAWQTGVL